MALAVLAIISAGILAALLVHVLGTTRADTAALLAAAALLAIVAISRMRAPVTE